MDPRGAGRLLARGFLEGENVAEPITPATMGPLLVWALRFVELFAPDILAAHAERRRLHAAADVLNVPIIPGCDAGLQSFLADLEAKEAPIPVADWNPRIPLSPAALFLSAKTGCPVRKVHQVMRKPHWRAYIKDHHEPAMLTTPVTATLGGQPWHEPFEFYRSSTLVKHLTTACFIVISYLTGMRTGEVLALQTGCCPDLGSDETVAKRHLIYGPALDDDPVSTDGEDDQGPVMVHGRQFKGPATRAVTMTPPEPSGPLGRRSAGHQRGAGAGSPRAGRRAIVRGRGSRPALARTPQQPVPGVRDDG